MSEIDPADGSAHQVSYSFFNLCFRDGDMANPVRIQSGVPFEVSVPLNLIGHTFTRGWRIRVSVAPSNFPTLWQQENRATLTLHIGTINGLPASSITLPHRAPRSGDARLQGLLPSDSPVHVANVEANVPAEELRAGSNTRDVESFMIGRRRGTAVTKVYDQGRYRYDGHLDGIVVDQLLRENYRILDGDPLSLVCTTSSTNEMERSAILWKVRMETSASVWSSRDRDGQAVFHYEASIRTFIADARGRLQPFESREVRGSIPRTWG